MQQKQDFYSNYNDLNSSKQNAKRVTVKYIFYTSKY